MNLMQNMHLINLVVKLKLFGTKRGKLPENTDLVVVPGGFSYGDYLRSGAIADLQISWKMLKICFQMVES